MAAQLPLLGGDVECGLPARTSGVEALGNTLRIELASSGARVGVAYFGELATDMTRRGFGTEAARRRVDEALAIAREEHASLTTRLPPR